MDGWVEGKKSCEGGVDDFRCRKLGNGRKPEWKFEGTKVKEIED
jgi:hypothetical protein